MRLRSCRARHPIKSIDNATRVGTARASDTTPDRGASRPFGIGRRVALAGADSERPRPSHVDPRSRTPPYARRPDLKRTIGGKLFPILRLGNRTAFFLSK